jgi:probable F420-dependent oxidoreductase
MKFTATVGMADPTFYVPLAQAAEAAGYDGLSVPDSVCYPERSDSSYPYNADGSREFLENKPFIEPLVAITAMGQATSSLVFSTFVVKLPLHNPVLYAKEVTSVAVMTGNRLHLGVGTSPWPDDYEVVGLPWEGRGARCDECIEVIRGLAAGGYFSYEGEFYRFPPVKLNPVPDRPVPILIGGHSPANLRRAARLGDGWMSAGSTTADLTVRLARLAELRREYGRADVPFEIHATTEDSFTPDGVRRLEDLGVTHTSGGFGRFDPYGQDPDPESLAEKVENLERYADQVIGRLG